MEISDENHENRTPVSTNLDKPKFGEYESTTTVSIVGDQSTSKDLGKVDEEISTDFLSVHKIDNVGHQQGKDTKTTISMESESPSREIRPDSCPEKILFKYLTTEFLQRSPSAQTVGKMTIPKYDTLPKSKKESEMKEFTETYFDNWDHTDNANVGNSEDSIPHFSENHLFPSKTIDNSIISHSTSDFKIAGPTSENDMQREVLKPDLRTPKTFVTDEQSQIELNIEHISDHVCIECVTAIQVFSKDNIRPGDHICLSGRIYDHHAIVVGIDDNKTETNDNEALIEIVHATNTATKATLALLHPFGNKAVLRQVNEIVNFEKNKVMVFKYSDTMETFKPQEIVRRATKAAASYRDGKESEFKYNLFENNCEHFATWCVTGRKLSIQVRKFTMVFWMFIKSGFYDISDEWIRNEKEYDNGMLCKTCYARNKVLLDIPRKYIDCSDDVNAGDVIVYSYYLLWHNAVVLRKLKSRETYIKCEIAHYAYLGPFKHRTILKENLLIPLDSTVMVLKYPDKFNLFSQREVIERAESRIGEQMFSFFRNDSSQFSRWCKLKLNRTK